MSNRLFGWLTINQMLFSSHLVLVMSIILGMSYSRYNSEWELRVEQAASIASSQITSHLTLFSTSIAGRNYANLMMPSTKESIWGIKDLLFMEVSGTTDYQNKTVGVRYMSSRQTAWRTDVTQDELEQLIAKKQQLVELKHSTPSSNEVRHKKLDYLINKRQEDISALSASLKAHSSYSLPWSMPEQFFSQYALNGDTNTLHIRVKLNNRNGGLIWAVFDASDLELMKRELLLVLFTEALIALTLSLILIYGVTKWIVAPIKDLATSMKQDIESIDIKTLPEIKRSDEIGELARSYSGLIQKSRNQLKVLKKMSDTDPLTGLGSRHKYAHTAETFSRNTLEQDQYLCVSVCDIDNFKAFNDTYGHTEGDNALCAVANTIDTTLSQRGIAYRFGGEEFVVLISASSYDELNDIINNIHNNIEALGIPHVNNDKFDVLTISIGAIIIPPNVLEITKIDHSTLLAQSIEMADQKLYKSKNLGRNQIIAGVFLTSTVSPPTTSI